MALPHEPIEFRWSRLSGRPQDMSPDKFWFSCPRWDPAKQWAKEARDGDEMTVRLANKCTVVIRPLSPERKALRLARAA
jgi:hypothetical protein